MIPLRDENPRKSFPFVTLLIIAVNVSIYVYMYWLRPELTEGYIFLYGAIPHKIVHLNSLHTILTSMFIHGGFFHLAGNMLYLWIFGDNVEDACGHFRFLGFYLLSGLAAFFAHFIISPFADIPMVGASGAISGVLGAYALKFPGARVYVFVPIFIWIWRIFAIPAVIVLGFWFVMQLWSGLFFSASGGGVAWFAHIGGFIAGLLLAKKCRRQIRYRDLFDNSVEF